MKKLMHGMLSISIVALASCGTQTEIRLPDDTTSEELVSDDNLQFIGDQFTDTSQIEVQAKERILSGYEHLDPKKVVPSNLLKKAVVYFDTNKSKIKNQNYLTVIDFSKKSTKARFFIINLKTGSVWAIHTAHGTGSDANSDGYAEKFSNVSGSNASSLGFYLTAETYSGKNGYSLRLDGLSSTNSRVRARAVVIHGAAYVSEASVIQGRSWGCPAVSYENRTEVINRLKNGSLIYAGRSLLE